MSFKYREILNSLLHYFFRGLLIIAPVFLTGYAVYSLLRLLNDPIEVLFEQYFGFRIYGLGLISLIFLIICIGFVGSTFLIQPILKIFEGLLLKVPFIKLIYTSLKDLFAAFVSEKKKFNKPVLVEMGKNSGINRIGFITSEDLSHLEIKDKVAVYFPLSYAFTGQLFIVNKDLVTQLPDEEVAEIMKFIVSGGVTRMEE
jgi:uncharacterized membrane protein